VNNVNTIRFTYKIFGTGDILASKQTFNCFLWIILTRPYSVFKCR